MVGKKEAAPSESGEGQEGTHQTAFELEARNPTELTSKMVEHLNILFPKALSFTYQLLGLHLARLVPRDGIVPRSYVATSVDQYVGFAVDYQGRSVSGFHIADVGAPYLPQLGEGVRLLDSSRDGQLDVVFADSAESKTARVSIGGSNRGVMVTAASAYLLGVKAGQENPR